MTDAATSGRQDQGGGAHGRQMADLANPSAGQFVQAILSRRPVVAQERRLRLSLKTRTPTSMANSTQLISNALTSFASTMTLKQLTSKRLGCYPFILAAGLRCQKLSACGRPATRFHVRGIYNLCRNSWPNMPIQLPGTTDIEPSKYSDW